MNFNVVLGVVLAVLVVLYMLKRRGRPDRGIAAAAGCTRQKNSLKRGRWDMRCESSAPS